MRLKKCFLLVMTLVLILPSAYPQEQWDEYSFQKNIHFMGMPLNGQWGIFRIFTEPEIGYEAVDPFISNEISGKDHFLLFDRGRKALTSTIMQMEGQSQDIFYIDAVSKTILNLTNDENNEIKTIRDFARQGALVLYTSYAASRYDFSSLRVIGLDGKTRRTLETPVVDGVNGACWLDDQGNRAFFLYRTGRDLGMGIWDMKNNSMEFRKRRLTHEYYIYDVDTSRNKIILACADADISDYVYYLQEDRLVEISGSEEGGFQSYRWSPDGASLACLTYAGDSCGLYVWSEKTGERRRLINDVVNGARWLANDKLAYDLMGKGICVINLDATGSTMITEVFESAFFDAMACPHLYAVDQQGVYKSLGETLENRRYVMPAEAEKISLDNSVLKQGRVRIKIYEIHDEITFIESIKLEYGGKIFTPSIAPANYKKDTRGLLKLNKGDYIEAEFQGLEGDAAGAVLIIKGYYLPLH